MDKESYGKCSKWKLSWKHVIAGIFKDGGFVKFSEHFFVKIDVFQTKVIQASTCGADASTCSKVSFSTKSVMSNLKVCSIRRPRFLDQFRILTILYI